MNKIEFTGKAAKQLSKLDRSTHIGHRKDVYE